VNEIDPQGLGGTFSRRRVYARRRNGLRRLARDYAYKELFDGVLQHCIVRFPLDEASTDCMLGANGDGLYMSSSIEALKKKQAVVIPLLREGLHFSLPDSCLWRASDWGREGEFAGDSDRTERHRPGPAGRLSELAARKWTSPEPAGAGSVKLSALGGSLRCRRG
jgi:hypothetical protein